MDEYDRTHIVFLDLETTGLDIVEDDILEIAALVVDLKELKVRGQYGSVIRPPDESDWMAKLEANPVALKMHKENGLIERIQFGVSMEHASSQIIRMIDQHSVFGKTSLPIQMAGSCVSCFDLPLLKVQSPLLAERFHYRTCDVSVLRSFLEQWDPEIIRDPDYPPASTDHRAAADCFASLNLLRFYRKIVVT